MSLPAGMKDVETKELYDEVSKFYNVYHIHVTHHNFTREHSNEVKSFAEVIGKGHVYVSKVEEIANNVIDIILESAGTMTTTEIPVEPDSIGNHLISW